jgi:hypothetical protein
MQRLGAIRKHRPESLAQIQAPLIEFREQCDQLGRGSALISGERLHLTQQLVIVQPGDEQELVRHAPVVASQFLPFEDARRRDFNRHDQIQWRLSGAIDPGALSRDLGAVSSNHAREFAPALKNVSRPFSCF